MTRTGRSVEPGVSSWTYRCLARRSMIDSLQSMGMHEVDRDVPLGWARRFLGGSGYIEVRLWASGSESRLPCRSRTCLRPAASYGANHVPFNRPQGKVNGDGDLRPRAWRLARWRALNG